MLALPPHVQLVLLFLLRKGESNKNGRDTVSEIQKCKRKSIHNLFTIYVIKVEGNHANPYEQYQQQGFPLEK